MSWIPEIVEPPLRNRTFGYIVSVIFSIRRLGARKEIKIKREGKAEEALVLLRRTKLNLAAGFPSLSRLFVQFLCSRRVAAAA
jgi:hypothetical protein